MRTLSALTFLGLAACAPKAPGALNHADSQRREDISDEQVDAEIAAEELAREAFKRGVAVLTRKAVETETATVTAHVRDRCGVPLNFVPGTTLYGHPSATAEYAAASPEDAACVYGVASEEHCDVEISPITSSPTTTPSVIGNVVCNGWDGIYINPDGTKVIKVGF